MDVEHRVGLAEKSKSSNKKLAQIIIQKEDFMSKIQGELSKVQKADIQINKDIAQNDSHDNNDISVCVRVRPLLEYESTLGYFETVHASDSSILAFEPRFSVKGVPKLITSHYKVDSAFGPTQSSLELYDDVVVKRANVIETGLTGGISTIFAYGQTASGKTYTISGILDNLARDLMSQKGQHLQLYLSIFEIIGNDITDLLSDNKEKVEICEDKFGKINVKNVKEVLLEDLQGFNEALQVGKQSRMTSVTFKNDCSSRSHAVFSIRVVNTKLKEIEDGRIFVIDLAGSENAADAQFHDKSRVNETRAINKSLMALKDCIRNRALSAVNMDKFFHIPYRLSKLTLLLKDAFEVESHRLCKTVVIANVSPSVADIAMSLNSLRYVTPLKIGQSNRAKVILNTDNPSNWSNADLRSWVEKASKKAINPEQLCPHESGMQILRLPEAIFIERIMAASNHKWSEKQASGFYKQLWKLLIDARTKERKQMMTCKTGGVSNKERLVKEHEIYVRILSERDKLEQ